MKRWQFWIPVVVGSFAVDFLDEMNGGRHTMAALLFGAALGFLLSARKEDA